MSKIRSTNRGFTLIELLVVVSVIALLASMLLTGISMLRDSAKRTQCAQRMRMLGLGMMAHAQDNEGQLVWAKMKIWPGSNGWFSPLIEGSYLDGIKPTDSWLSVQGPAFQCPANRVAQRGDFWYDFRPSVWLLGTEDAAPGTPARSNVAELSPITRTGLLYEVIIGTPWWIPCNESPADQYSGWTAQHRNTANIVFADLHVGSHRYSGPVNGEGLATEVTGWDITVAANQGDAPGELIWSRAQLRLPAIN